MIFPQSERPSLAPIQHNYTTRVLCT